MRSYWRLSVRQRTLVSECVDWAVIVASADTLQVSGIDARLGEIGEAIQETMESYEVVVGTDTYRGRPIV